MIAVICKCKREFDYFMSQVDQADIKKFKCVTHTDHTRGAIFTDVISIGYDPDYKLKEFAETWIR